MKDKYIKNVQQIFIDFLASKQLRLTSPRKTIFNEIVMRETHTNIDELYNAVKQKDSRIGLATMYRTLKLLIQADLVREVATAGGKPFYEAVVGRSHHDHLTCEKCGSSIEFNNQQMELLQEEIAKSYGYTLTGHALYLMGLCPDCRKKKNIR